MEEKNTRRAWQPKPLLILFLSLLFLLLNSSQINLLTSDLPRHLTNGKMILEGVWKVFDQNLYSYTYPNYPFINHHWATGVVFYVLEKLSGLGGLSIFYRLLGLGTFLIFYLLTTQITNIRVATWASLLALPIIAYRTEIRPEGFSAFFFGMFLLILYRWSHHSGKNRQLLLLPILMVCWVNLHIYFFSGFIVLATFFLELLLNPSSRLKSHKFSISQKKASLLWLGKITFLCVVATFINPLTYRVALFPLFIFNDYGYQLLENQTPFFFLNRDDFLIPQLPSFFLIILILCVAWGPKLLLTRSKAPLFILILGSFTTLFSLLAVRNFSLFGLMTIPFLAVGWQNLPQSWRGLRVKTFQLSALAISWVVYLGLAYPRLIEATGLYPMEGINRAVEFFKNNNLHGPILNNYDIGGYLIYNLYPTERVFVDNRPEAYPRSFFTETYVPLLENEEYWHHHSPAYAFNLIFFSRSDLTPWAQSFLRRRVKDPEWKLIYLDDYSIMFIKNIPENNLIIQRFQLPEL